MKEEEKISVKIELTEEEVSVLAKMAESRGLSVDEFVSKVLSKFCSY